ncbi:MAG: CDGSH iron-sulfur domain-containing protein [Bacteroidales bacterium]|nr:CDGSH iron-sulfur domain-containing protein [Bacteroidales bacterium]
MGEYGGGTYPQNQEIKSTTMTSFCRCGSSRNMPYCDGTHKRIKVPHRPR